MNLVRDKTIVLAVTGSIAAYKAATLASQLAQAGAQVFVAMTDAATHFVAPLTFETLTRHPVALNVLALNAESHIEHVTLAKRADLVLIAPATANTLAKLAHGRADDIVSAIALDTRAPIMVAPAMETGMWENPATQENIARLADRGVIVIEPSAGHLASGAQGQGRMAEPDTILARIRQHFAQNGPLRGTRIVVTLGGTREPIDPVRVITNHSSGKMGWAIADEALSRGATVELITAVDEPPPLPGAVISHVTTSQEMLNAVLSALPTTDVLIMAAAPADFRPATFTDHKIKKEATEQLTIDLVRNPDILGAVAAARQQDPTHTPRVVVGFAAETDNLLANARGKLERKRLEMIVANPVPQTFGSENVKATVLFASGETLDLSPMTKEELAGMILDRIEPMMNEQTQEPKTDGE